MSCKIHLLVTINGAGTPGVSSALRDRPASLTGPSASPVNHHVMARSLTATLWLGYGPAALAAGGVLAAGGGWPVAVGLFWIGGAVATLLGAALFARGSAGTAAGDLDEAEPTGGDDSNRALAEALPCWEDERLDRGTDPEPRHAAG